MTTNKPEPMMTLPPGASPKPTPRSPKPKKPIKRSAMIARRKAPRKLRKSSLAALRRGAWEAFAKWIKFRDGGVCFTCDKTGLSGHDCQAGHGFVFSAYPAIRYDERNVHVQCFWCNHVLQGNQAIYLRRIVERYGQAELDRLEALKPQARQYRRADFEQMIEHYRAKLTERAAA